MKSFRPTTPSRRHMTVIEYKKLLTKTGPFKALTMNIQKAAGRNNQGVITMRHQGGGNKQTYRMVDFRQDKFDISGRVETLEYDPYRSAFIALVCYKDGERRYILAPKDLKVGDEIITSPAAPLKVGNRVRLINIPIGYLVYNIELLPSTGGKLARSAGAYAEVLGYEGEYSTLKLSSGEVRKVKTDCYASIGQVSNPDHNLVTIGKAGRSRHMGIRPTVRGKVMNPCDHPYGGGEGRTQRGTKRPKDIWGNITGGRKTRKKKKWSSVLIIKRRKK
ncbi:MAG: 50S ribosomal protein L2 [Candidatus Pacebacteria bacterium]|nr:50S ribosomal protein L2 [Candidatus Paceibacterota bacterium]